MDQPRHSLYRYHEPNTDEVERLVKFYRQKFPEHYHGVGDFKIFLQVTGLAEDDALRYELLKWKDDTDSGVDLDPAKPELTEETRLILSLIHI